MTNPSCLLSLVNSQLMTGPVSVNDALLSGLPEVVEFVT
ncbi:hypothetical protein L842_5514 [Mycobacterium intracellulare MIN_052511_1280]|nr:hypothetical protein L842_5514 [Mycobacterium intracellulare MIN_052511_1280]